MLTKRDIAVRWAAYALTSLLLILLHELLVRRVVLWGVTPFLPPILAAIIASQEDCPAGAIFSMAMGILCDLTVSAPFPGLYTLSLTLAALVSFLLAERVLQPGLLCALLTSAVTFWIVDLFCMAGLAFRGATFGALLSVSVREMLVSLLQFPVCYPILRFVHDRCTL